MGRMLASATQTLGVILIVAAAAGYLGLILRRSGRRGGCGSCSDMLSRGEGCEPEPRSPQVQQFVPGDNLVEQARRLAKNQTNPDQTQ